MLGVFILRPVGRRGEGPALRERVELGGLRMEVAKRVKIGWGQQGRGDGGASTKGEGRAMRVKDGRGQKGEDRVGPAGKGRRRGQH